MDAPVAVLVLEEADLGIEVLAGPPVLEADAVRPVVVFGVDVVGVVAPGQARASRFAPRSRHGEAARRRRAGRPAPHVRFQSSGASSLPVADRLTNIAPTPERLGSSRLTRSTEKLLPGAQPTSSVCMLSRPTLMPPTLPLRRAPRDDRHERAVLVEADAPAEETDRSSSSLADREQPRVLEEERAASPGKRRLNRVRLICCVSTSTCAKSVL